MKKTYHFIVGLCITVVFLWAVGCSNPNSPNEAKEGAKGLDSAVSGSFALNRAASYETITLPFTKDGKGEFFWKFTTMPENISSWNLDKLEVNGKDITNVWVAGNDLPAKKDGFYYVHYKGSYGWSHVEIKGKSEGSSSSESSSSSEPASSSSVSSEPASSSSSSSHGGNGKLPLHFHQTGSWATNITSGLEGRVIKVTNLNKSGSGSLRAAIEASGKRLVVFEVGGVINMSGSRLNIKNGDLYVAGETAPYPGITIIRTQTSVSGNNIVLSHLSFRLGDGDGGASDTMGISGDNIVLNHVAASWSIDECVSMSGANKVTLYKTMVTEALSYATHKEGEHSKGSLIQRGTNNTALYHTLYAHNALRNPRLHSKAKVALINGVIYNWMPGNDDEGEKKFHFVVHMNQASMSVVGTVGLQGPDSVGDTLISGHKSGKGSAYMKDNLIFDPSGKPLKVYNTKNITPLSSPPLWPQGVVVQPAHEAFYEVLRTVGPRPGDRDPINARVVATVAKGTGKRVNSQDDVGGYPKFAQTRHSVTVPNGLAARRAWLDKLEDSFAVDRSLDLSRLYKIVGSEASDKLK